MSLFSILIIPHKEKKSTQKNNYSPAIIIENPRKPCYNTRQATPEDNGRRLALILMKGGKNPIRKEGVLMDIGIFVGIIGLCISCYMLGVQHEKDRGNKNDRPLPRITVILINIQS